MRFQSIRRAAVACDRSPLPCAPVDARRSRAATLHAGSVEFDTVHLDHRPSSGYEAVTARIVARTSGAAALVAAVTLNAPARCHPL
jgi:hypothetical protein